jgi:O-antigen ligase
MATRTLAKLREQLDLEDYLVLSAILFMPWAFGGVEIWAYRTASLLLVGAGCTVLWKRGVAGLGLSLRVPETRWLWPVLLLAVWAALQVLPLPPPTLRAVSPGAHKIYSESIPGYPGPAPADRVLAIEEMALREIPEVEHASSTPADRPDAVARSNWRPLSLQPDATRERLAWYIALLFGFLVVRQRVAAPERYQFYRGALFLVLIALALFALVQAATWNGKLYWVRPMLLAGSRAFGPYVNPNHFAGVMELIVPWLVGFAWARFRTARGDTRGARFLFLLEVSAVCLVAALAAASKAGTVLIGVSVTILGILGARTRRARLAWIGGAVALWVAGALVMSGTVLQTRFDRFFADARASGLVLGERQAAWATGLSMFQDFPVSGVGVGAFREVYPQYVVPGVEKILWRMHNDYLEVLLEGGIVAAVLVVWLAFAFWRRVPAAIRSPNSGRWSTSRLGLALGVASLSVHAFVDFNHQMPANALLFVAACAMLLPYDPTPRPTTSTPRRLGITVIVAGLLLTYGYRAATGAIGGIAFARGAVLVENGLHEEAIPLLEAAAVGENRVRALRDVARQRVQISTDPTPEANAELLDRATDELIESIWISPASWRSWKGLAEVYHRRTQLLRETNPPEPQVELAPAEPAVDEPPAEAMAAETVAMEPAVDEPVVQQEVISWTDLSRPALITVGLMREAQSRAPNWYALHDSLAIFFWEEGLVTQALDSVWWSARVYPRYGKHSYDYWFDDGVPRSILDAFAEGALEGLGKTPYFKEVDHVIALGRIELERNELARAAGTLISAMELAEDDPQRFAEASYYLGRAMDGLGRVEEAREHLKTAASHPALGNSALALLRKLDEQTEESTPSAAAPDGDNSR